MQKRATGFTIVELLIVIVVIGILAAIVIIAFNGVQQRARNSQTISAVREYAKIYTAYAIDNQKHPLNSNYCHGSGYPGDLCWDNRVYTPNTLVDTQLKKYAPTLPQPSTARVYRNPTEGWRAGILYVNDFSLRYQLEGATTDCGIPGATRAFNAGVSSGPECNLKLQDPSTL